MKRIIFIFLLTFITPLYAYQQEDHSIFAFADALLWRVREGGADNWGQTIQPPGSTQKVNILDAPFNWRGGFRAGVGYEAASWDLVAAYTHFKTEAVRRAQGEVYSGYTGNFFVGNTDGADFGPHYQQGKMRWNFLFNTVDVEWGRSFNEEKALHLRPFVGIKGARIDQRIHTTWLNPVVPTNFTSAVENLKNDFWGVGPEVGLDTTWPFCRRNFQTLSLVGDVSFAVLWSHWQFKDVYENNAGTSVTVHSDDINGGSTMGRGLFGVEWERDFSKAAMKVRLAYEAQVWFNQLQYYTFNMGRLSYLMSLQGGVLDFSFNFQ